MLKRRDRNELRLKRHRRVRRNVAGTQERPRLSVYRSLNHIYAQLIDDEGGRTILAASSLDPEVRAKLKNGGNKDAAKLVGEVIAKRAQGQGIKQIVFDRGGYIYHGRVAALAAGAREAGLEF